MSGEISPHHSPAPAAPTKYISHDMYEKLHPELVDGLVAPADSSEPSTNHYRVIPTAHLFFERVAERIGQAEHSVNLQFYTLEADKEVEGIIKASTAAAERGVKVRIRVDHLVSDPRRLASTLQQHKVLNGHPNISVRHMTAARAAGASAGNSVLRRDHKKIVTIDGGHEDGQAYIGGVNLAARNKRWNDFMVELRGPIAALVHEDFEDTWHGSNTKPKRIADDSEPGTFLLTDTQANESIITFVTEQIMQAQQRIWLETPYLDMKSIGAALIAAKKQRPTLDIRVIVPKFNNSPMDKLRTSATLRELHNADIRAFAYGKNTGGLTMLSRS